MRKADIVSAAVVVLFGLALIFYIIPVWTPEVIESDYGLQAQDMPTVAAAIVTGLALLLLINSLRGKPTDARPDGSAESDEDAAPPITRDNARYLFVCSALLISMAVLFRLGGFLVAGPLTIAGFMLLMRETRWLQVLLTAVVATGALWLFFWQLLSIPLP